MRFKGADKIRQGEGEERVAECFAANCDCFCELKRLGLL